MTTYNGTAGDDNITGTSGDDTFRIFQGGNDTVSGGDGDDLFQISGALTADDRLDGGTGNDILQLIGDYGASNLALADATIQNIEKIQLGPGHNYWITSADGNVAAGQTLTVDGSTLGTNDNFSFDGSAETDGNFHLIQGAGRGGLGGGAGNDIIDMSHGTHHYGAYGHGGDDILIFGPHFDATADFAEGDEGNDTLRLTGDFSTQHQINNNNTSSIENVQLTAGFNYNLLIPHMFAESTITLDGSALGAANTFIFNGASAQTAITILGGAGNDSLTLTPQADTIDISQGGDDVVSAGGGDDAISAGAALTATDGIDGGAGNDVLTLNGDYSAGLTFGAKTVGGVETLNVMGAHSYTLVTNDGTVGAGLTLTVHAGSLGAGNALSFDGSAETDGRFAIAGGAGNDTLTGGASADCFNLTHGGNDAVTGGGGADTVNANPALGNETFVFNAVTDSTSTGYDHIVGANFANDVFHVSGIAGAVTGVDTAITTGTLNWASFDTQLETLIGEPQLGAHHAVLFTASGGTLAGHTFLVIDENGTAGYQAGQDLVIWTDTPTGTLTTADFS